MQQTFFAHLNFGVNKVVRFYSSITFEGNACDPNFASKTSGS
jgi:hypothetical protein